MLQLVVPAGDPKATTHIRSFFVSSKLLQLFDPVPDPKATTNVTMLFFVYNAVTFCPCGPHRRKS